MQTSVKPAQPNQVWPPNNGIPQSWIANTGSASNDLLRITFGREPVHKPFRLTIANGNYSVAIQADGVGHFTVVDPGSEGAQ